jgi:hypothetical protein
VFEISIYECYRHRMSNDETVILTLRMRKVLITKLDAEAERRSALAGAPGAISRNIMARIIFEQVLEGPVPTAKPKVKTPKLVSRKPQKALKKTAKTKGQRKGKVETSTAISQEERDLQKRVKATDGGYKSLAEHLGLSYQQVWMWARGQNKRAWPQEHLFTVRKWLDEQG